MPEVPAGAKMGPLGGLVGGGKDGGDARPPERAKPGGGTGRRVTHSRMGGKNKADIIRAATIRRARDNEGFATPPASRPNSGGVQRIEEDDGGSVSTLGDADPVARGRRATQAPRGLRRATIEHTGAGGIAALAGSRHAGGGGGGGGAAAAADAAAGGTRGRISFAFGNSMTITVESRAMALCRCPATRPWRQLLSAHDGTTVAVVKEHVVGSLGGRGGKAPAELQILRYRGMELHDDKTLRHYGIKDGAKLLLSLQECAPAKRELRLGFLQHRFPALCRLGDAAPKLDPTAGKLSPRLDCSSAWTLHTGGGKLAWKFPGTTDGFRGKTPGAPPARLLSGGQLWPPLLGGDPSDEASFETVITPPLGQSLVPGSILVKNTPRRPVPPASRVRGSFGRRRSSGAKTAPGKARGKPPDIMVLGN